MSRGFQSIQGGLLKNHHFVFELFDYGEDKVSFVQFVSPFQTVSEDLPFAKAIIYTITRRGDAVIHTSPIPYRIGLRLLPG